MFWTRLLSGIVLIAVALGTIYAGGAVLAAVLLFLSLAGMREYYKAVHRKGRTTALEIAAYVGAVLYYAVLYLGRDKLQSLVIVGVFLAVMIAYVVAFPKYDHREAASSFFGFFYVAVMLGFIFMTRSRLAGRVDVWLIFISSWGADTLAYCVGSLFGRHKMTPVLSPHKSVEGAFGGVAGAALLAFIYALIFRQPAVSYLVTGAIAAVISIFGDLAASAIKRQNDIKDYGKLIPGHGGVLDRFDSVIFTAPVIYFCCLLFLG